MIQLTPLDQTVAGQELIQMGMNEGILKGLEKGRIEGRTEGRTEGRMEGELVGKIHFAQRMLKRRITPKKKLLEKNPKELRAILKKLEAELRLV